MSLPAPTLSVPSLSSDQLYFNGLTMGYGTPFGIKNIDGLDKGAVRTGNTPRPRSRGAYVGLNLADQRKITLTMDVGAPFGSYTTVWGALAALRTACANDGTAEYPLWIQLLNSPFVACMARCTQRTAKVDITLDLGGMAKDVAVELTAADPYLYSAPTGAPSVGLASPSGGFHFPLTFPLSFGGAMSPNSTTITNAGDVTCYPVLVITGPCLNPSVQNQSVSGNPLIGFDIQLNTGDQLVVDCDLGSILYYPAGETEGAAYPQILQEGSTFITLPAPGPNTILFNSQDASPAAGTLAIWSASAYDGLT